MSAFRSAWSHMNAAIVWATHGVSSYPGKDGDSFKYSCTGLIAKPHRLRAAARHASGEFRKLISKIHAGALHWPHRTRENNTGTRCVGSGAIVLQWRTFRDSRAATKSGSGIWRSPYLTSVPHWLAGMMRKSGVSAWPSSRQSRLSPLNPAGGVVKNQQPRTRSCAYFCWRSWVCAND